MATGFWHKFKNLVLGKKQHLQQMVWEKLICIWSRLKLDPLTHPAQKSTQKLIKGFNTRPEDANGENTSRYRHRQELSERNFSKPENNSKNLQIRLYKI